MAAAERRGRSETREEMETKSEWPLRCVRRWRQAQREQGDIARLTRAVPFGGGGNDGAEVGAVAHQIRVEDVVLRESTAQDDHA